MFAVMNQTNPFPGMNPFLEQRWQSVNLRLIALMLEDLNLNLPDDLAVDGEVRIDVGGGKQYLPDISILQDPADSWKSGLAPVWSPETTGTSASVTAPLILHVDAPRERWIAIRADSGTLVTVIELLSPTNKTHGRTACQNKRRDYTDAGVNVVEIDLLRGGDLTVDVDGTDYGPLVAGKGEHCASAAPPARCSVKSIPFRCAAGCPSSACRCG